MRFTCFYSDEYSLKATTSASWSQIKNVDKANYMDWTVKDRRSVNLPNLEMQVQVPES